MGNTTDDLLELAAQVSSAAHLREVDMLLAAGEQISIAMLTMALLDLGVPAVSLTGPQAGILTDRSHGKARIIGMRADRVAAAIERGEVPIVAGFQGLSQDEDVTTLVEADPIRPPWPWRPRSLPGSARSIPTSTASTQPTHASCRAHASWHGSPTTRCSSWRRAAHGAVLRSVEYARRTGVPLHVRSSFGEDEGTWVVDERESVEHAIISGIAHDTSEAKVTLLRVPDQPGVAAAVLRPLAEASINVDMIVQNVSAEGHTDISFTLPEDDLPRPRRSSPAFVAASRPPVSSRIATSRRFP